MRFSEWLVVREMLSPVPFPSVTNASPEVGYKLKQLTAFPTYELKKKKKLRQGSQDGDWK